jgi:hypothetical protein
LSYFNRNTVSVDSKGVEKRTYATGVVMTVQEDGTIKKKICLLTSLQTEELCKILKLILSMQRKSCTVCKDLRMLRYQILEEMTILQTQCIFFPKLKNANVDSLETSLIHEGISELKIKTNPELNALQKKFTIT